MREHGHVCPLALTCESHWKCEFVPDWRGDPPERWSPTRRLLSRICSPLNFLHGSLGFRVPYLFQTPGVQAERPVLVILLPVLSQQQAKLLSQSPWV